MLIFLVKHQKYNPKAEAGDIRLTTLRQIKLRFISYAQFCNQAQLLCSISL